MSGLLVRLKHAVVAVVRCRPPLRVAVRSGLVAVRVALTVLPLLCDGRVVLDQGLVPSVGRLDMGGVHTGGMDPGGLGVAPVRKCLARLLVGEQLGLRPLGQRVHAVAGRVEVLVDVSGVKLVVWFFDWKAGAEREKEREQEEEHYSYNIYRSEI